MPESKKDDSPTSTTTTTSSKSNCSSSSSRSGHLSSASYALLMLLVGVPIWWRTTEVYRVSLPYQEIEDLDRDLDLRMKVDVQLVTDDAREGHRLGPELQKLLTDSDVYTFLLGGRAPSREEIRLLQSSSSITQLDSDLHRLHANVPPGTVILFEVGKEADHLMSDFGSAEVVVGQHRCVFFSGRAQAVELARVLRQVVLGEEAVRRMVSAVEAPHHSQQQQQQQQPQRQVDDLRRVQAAGGYDILFSLLIPQPEKVMLRWDIARAIDTFVEPFLRDLGTNFSTISVKSQVLYLTRLNLKPKKDASSGDNFVDHRDLGFAINPVESQLASHVSSLPRLNFLVYVPTEEQSPLHIVEGDGGRLPSNAFLIPRWGGVAIYNVATRDAGEEPVREHAVDMARVMGIFVSQLRLLLGLQDQSGSAAILPLSGGSLRVWERDYLYRLRLMENLALSRATLQSLAHLLSQISNIVINDEIGEEVRRAVDACHVASGLIAEGGRLEEAFEESRKAFLASEKAFFDPSLLALLYFPEDQKYAVYIPLFLPVGIPVIMSLKTMFMFFKTGWVSQAN